MQIYKKKVKYQNLKNPSQLIDFDIYKKNCETFRHTATLLIHILKYLPSVNDCFTKRKFDGRV